jgi:pyruvate-ferredoxin/flavodoxin oxidoreductase
MAYGTAYVAQIAMGANDAQTIRALIEAAAWPGPSLVIAYCTCTAHGMDMSRAMEHMKAAVKSGYWPLYRFHPTAAAEGQPFKLDSRAPSMPVREFAETEARFAILGRTHPERYEELMDLMQADIDERWRYYEQLAAMERTDTSMPDHVSSDEPPEAEARKEGES